MKDLVVVTVKSGIVLETYSPDWVEVWVVDLDVEHHECVVCSENLEPSDSRMGFWVCPSCGNGGFVDD